MVAVCSGTDFLLPLGAEALRALEPALVLAIARSAGCSSEVFEEELGVADQAEFDRKIAADFLIVEIDLHDLGSRQVVDRPLAPVGGVVVGEPRADADDEIGLAARASGADEARAAKRADRERMILRQHALGGQRRGGRDVELLGRRLQRVGRAGAHHATAGQQQRPLGFGDHAGNALDILGIGAWTIGLRRACAGRLDLALHHGELDVIRHLDEHRAGPA